MADVFSKRKRSEIMSRVRGTGNKTTELALTVFMRRHRIRGWRRHAKLFGNPDFVFRRRRVAVFVDGCFWHSCPHHRTQPAANRAFWTRKLARNKTRDKLVVRTLRQQGWRVLRIWQHELSRLNESRLMLRFRKALAI